MKKRLTPDFYNLTVKQLMDKRIWDLPLIEKDDSIDHVLNILGAKNHIWVVEDKKEKQLVGVITEHDILSILAPKNIPSYIFGMPDIKSIYFGTARTANDIMCMRLVTCQKDDKIKQVLEIMTKHRLRRLPVIDGKTIIGELTLNQLIRKYYEATQYYPITDEEG
ncbi:MAG: CBS domain-containing protein [Thermoplasmatota archaeon]